MKASRILVVLLGVFSLTTASSQSRQYSKPLIADLVMGPYLFISHIPYDAVWMQGARLGVEMKKIPVLFSAAYMVGQQADEKGDYGLTHHAGFEFSLFTAPADSRIRPYFMLGAGFLEFKSFSTDKYGIATQVAAGLELKVSTPLRAFLEPRYLNMAQMKLGGNHQLVVSWGLRARF